MSKEWKIQFCGRHRFNEIIRDREPRGLFLAFDILADTGEPMIAACDNTHGDAFVESFTGMLAATKWLRGDGMEAVPNDITAPQLATAYQRTAACGFYGEDGALNPLLRAGYREEFKRMSKLLALVGFEAMPGQMDAILIDAILYARL